MVNGWFAPHGSQACMTYPEHCHHFCATVTLEWHEAGRSSEPMLELILAMQNVPHSSYTLKEQPPVGTWLSWSEFQYISVIVFIVHFQLWFSLIIT